MAVLAQALLLSILACGFVQPQSIGPSCLEAPAPDPPLVPGSGWIAQSVSIPDDPAGGGNLTAPRSLLFDDAGNLLVVEQRVGIRRLRLVEVIHGSASCIQAVQNSWIVKNENLTHGIAFSNNFRTLFASSAGQVLAWAYNSAAGAVASRPLVVVDGMNTAGGHTTRTLLMSRRAPGTLLVSQGSGGNLDERARDRSSGISQLRAFDLRNPYPARPYLYAGGGGVSNSTNNGTSGTGAAGAGAANITASSNSLVAWGLRNAVGVAEHPVTGGVWTVENSVDGLRRSGVDVHEDNPGEELNYHGGGNYGYPDCFALWNATGVPDAGGLGVGDQFTGAPEGAPPDDVVDSECAASRVPPRLTFPAHAAPLDIKFAPDGAEAYVAFHGSWNRDQPSGYSVAAITFTVPNPRGGGGGGGGDPAAARNSTDALRQILSNADLSRCGGGGAGSSSSSCFRPTSLALALDSRARMRVLVASDEPARLYVLTRAEFTETGAGMAKAKAKEEEEEGGVVGFSGV